MDPSKESETPAPEAAEKPTETTKAPDVSMSLKDTSAAPSPSATAVVTAENPGHGLGIASLIVSILGVGVVGIILGIIGLNKSKKAGQKNGLAIAGIIVGILNVIVVSIIIAVSAAGIGSLAAKCAELGAGAHIEGGVTYTCS